MTTIATTIKTPRHHDANRPFGAAAMVKQVHRIDVAHLKVCNDPIPSTRMVPNKYATLFAALKVGQAIKCKPQETSSITAALRKWLKDGGFMGTVQCLRDYGDGMGRVWLVKKERAK